MIKGIERVTAGRGGESLLIIGTEKTAVYDTGMAYCGPALVQNVEVALNGKTLDYILLSHTHYDHVGGLPYLLERWPRAEVVGSAHGQSVFQKTGARDTIRRMSLVAADQYLKDGEAMKPFADANLRIDHVVNTGDRIHLGDRTVCVYETKGHTNCSLSYFLEEERILFTSESTGVALEREKVNAAFLTSYQDSLESIQLCKELNPSRIFVPHYRLVEEDWTDRYFDLALESMVDLKDFILSCLDQEMSQDELEEACLSRYWVGRIQEEQPKEAYLLNLQARARILAKEFRANQ